MEDYDYTPTLEDLRDFEEYEQELNNKKQDEIKQWSFTHNGVTRTLSRETICTLISHFLANNIPKETIDTVPLVDRLTVLTLFGHDINVLLKVVCKDLSDDEIQMIKEGKQYPYLMRFITSVVGDENLEYIRKTTSYLKNTRVLPYVPFYDADWSVGKKEILQSKYELISLWTPQHRPMWSYGTMALMESGCIPEHVMYRTEEAIEVDCIKFLTNLFKTCKQLLSDLRAQFGINAAQLSSKNAMKFTTSIYLLPFVEEYFRVKLINKPKKVCRHGLFNIVIDKWNDK